MEMKCLECKREMEKAPLEGSDIWECPECFLVMLDDVPDNLNVQWKKCTKCGEEKSWGNFTRSRTGLRSECKECRNKRQEKRRKEKPWRQTLVGIKERCNNPNFPGSYHKRGIKCLITEEQLRKLWFRDKAWELKRPSMDRIKEGGDYTYENCQYIELEENYRKFREFRKQKSMV